MRRYFILIFSVLILSLSLNAQVVRDEFEKGKRYFKQKEYLKAKLKFNYVIDNNTAYYEAYTYRARIYLETHQPDSALQDFATSIMKDKEAPSNYYYRAKYYYSIQEYDKAESDLNVVIEKKKGFTPAILLRAQIYEQNGKDELAFNDYDAAIKNGSKNYEIYYRRGLYFSKTNRNTAAIKDFETVIQKKSANTDAYYALAYSHQLLHQSPEAIKFYSKVIMLDETYQKAYEQRALLYYDAKEYEKALEDDKRLTSYFRMRVDSIFIRMAKAEMYLENLPSADRYLVKASSANANNEEALLLRSDIAVKRDRAATALSYLQRIHRINPDNYESWYMQAEIYYNTQMFDKAILALNECISINKYGKAFYLRGACYNALGDNDNACKDTRKSAELRYPQAIIDENKICK